MFTSSAGDRPGVPDVAVFLIGSEPDINEGSIASEAESARSQGIKLIALGLGNDYDGEALVVIASFRSEILILHDFDDLPMLVTPLIQLLRDSYHQETGECYVVTACWSTCRCLGFECDSLFCQRNTE